MSEVQPEKSGRPKYGMRALLLCLMVAAGIGFTVRVLRNHELDSSAQNEELLVQAKKIIATTEQQVSKAEELSKALERSTTVTPDQLTDVRGVVDSYNADLVRLRKWQSDFEQAIASKNTKVIELKRREFIGMVKRLGSAAPNSPSSEIRNAAEKTLFNYDGISLGRIALIAPFDAREFVRESFKTITKWAQQAINGKSEADREAAASAINNIAIYHGEGQQTLTQIDQDACKAAALLLLTSKEKEVHLAGIEALQFYSGQEVVKAISEFLQDPDWEARWRAAYSLGEIGDPSATAALGNAAKDSDEIVQGHAIAALGKLGGTEARAIL